MKKFMSISLAAVFVAGFAVAQDEVVIVGEMENDPAEVQVSLESALMSSYVWRGQVYNNDAVWQPQLTIEQYGVSLNIWGNYNLAGSTPDGISSDFSELDFSVAYQLPIDINEMAFDIGLINYNFPNSDTDSTTELFASATVLSWKEYIIPSVTLFGDIDEASGIYMLFDLVAPYQVSDYLAVEVGASVGYANGGYNDYYFGNGTLDPDDSSKGSTQDARFNDYNIYGNVSYDVTDDVSVSANLTYTMLEGGSIRDAASKTYDNDKKVWGGVNVAYSF